MVRRAVYEPIFSVPAPNASQQYSSPGQLYEKGKGFFSALSLTQTNLRREQIRRLLDLMHACLEKGDRTRAARAWSILVRCPEVNLASTGWSTVAKEFDSGSRLGQAQSVAGMLDRMLAAVARGPEQDDFDYLETHITSFPLSENPSLHVYAGMLALFLAQEKAPRRAVPAASPASSDTEMSSPQPDKLTQRRSAAQSQAQSLPELQPGYLLSAQTYLRTALRLYSAHDQVDSPAVSYVHYLLRLLRTPDEVDSENEDEAGSRQSSKLKAGDDDDEDDSPAVRRKLNSPISPAGSDSDDGRLIQRALKDRLSI